MTLQVWNHKTNSSNRTCSNLINYLIFYCYYAYTILKQDQDQDDEEEEVIGLAGTILYIAPSVYERIYR